MYKVIIQDFAKQHYGKILEDGEELEFLQDEIDSCLYSIFHPLDPTNITASIFYQTRYLVLSDLYKKVSKECE